MESLLTGILKRPFSSEESEMLRFVSPQGMAKINSDLSKGVNLEQTLTDMLQVFESLRRRRGLAEHSLSPAAQTILSRLNRFPTTDELLLVTNTPPMGLLMQINRHLNEGEVFEDILAELAMEYRQQQLMCDAQRIASEHQTIVSISRLAPTAHLPYDSSSLEISVGIVRRRDANVLRVGLSPIVTWFDETSRDSNEADSERLSVVVRSSPTAPSLLRSALKRQRQNPENVSADISRCLNGAQKNEENETDEASSVGYSTSTSSNGLAELRLPETGGLRTMVVGSRTVSFFLDEESTTTPITAATTPTEPIKEFSSVVPYPLPVSFDVPSCRRDSEVVAVGCGLGGLPRFMKFSEKVSACKRKLKALIVSK